MSVSPNSSEYFKKRINSINHPGMRQNEMIDGYKDWSKSYDKDLGDNAYRAPQNTALVMKQRFPEAIRSDVRILDVGAGTGLVADELKGLGFVHIDALEPVKDMLDVARQKGVYENYYEEFLSATEQTSIPNNTYDCVTGAGCFGDNHIPWQSLTEVLRIIKPGGLIVIGTKVADTDYYRELDEFLDGLVRDGRLIEQERSSSDIYLQGIEAKTYVLKVA